MYNLFAKNFLVLLLLIFFTISCTGGDNYVSNKVAKKNGAEGSETTTESSQIPANSNSTDESSSCAPALNFTMNSLKGEEISLCDFQGNVIMIVNTASECGFTGQYAGLEKIYKQYKDLGFVVLGFPANNFMNQEPGTNKDIAQFCQKNFGVTFPMFEKISVKGDAIHPFYKYLTEEVPDENIRGEIPWNFNKFLLNREGEVIAKFKPNEEPESELIISTIEKLL
jgi:glutathione peroxidase